MQTGSDDMVARRGLLPRIGHHNPHGREHRPEKNAQGGDKMHPGFYAVPSKKENSQKSTFQAKGKQALGGQGASENIPNIAGIHRPIGSKFKFHYDSRGHANPESQGEKLDPETGQDFVILVSGFEVKSFKNDHYQPDSDAQGRIDVVESNGKGKLYAGQYFNVHDTIFYLQI